MRERNRSERDRDDLTDTRDVATQPEDDAPWLLVGAVISDEENERRGRWVPGASQNV